MNNIVKFDLAATKLIQSLPVQARSFMAGITLCGSGLPIFATLGLGFILSGATTKDSFIFIIFSILLNLGLKQFLHRPRPDTLYVSRMRFKTHSFPSGHAFGSLIAYGFIAYFAIINLSIIAGLAVASLLWLLIFLIGVSRVYLGAHYPTDVIGGWILAMICLCFAVVIS